MVVAPELGDIGADIQLASPVCMVKSHLLSMQRTGGNPLKVNLGKHLELMAPKVSPLSTGLAHFWLCTGQQLFHFMCSG